MIWPWERKLRIICIEMAMRMYPQAGENHIMNTALKLYDFIKGRKPNGTQENQY